MTFELYPKINGVFKRHTDGPQKGKFIMGEFARPEFELLLDADWLWTEKVDGTNCRIALYPWGEWQYHDEPLTDIGGRTDNAQLHKDLLIALQEVEAKLDRAARRCEYKDGITLYGEGYGAGIQKGGGNYRPDKGFVLFDARVGNYWLERENLEELAESLELEIIPLVCALTLREALGSFRSDPNGLYYPSAWAGVSPEGWVGAPKVQLFNRFGERIQTKLKWADF